MFFISLRTVVQEVERIVPCCALEQDTKLCIASSGTWQCLAWQQVNERPLYSTLGHRNGSEKRYASEVHLRGTIIASSHTEQQSHTSQRPLSRPLPGLQAERPHVGGPSDLGLVERTLVDVPGLLPVIGHRSDRDDGHGGGQFLQAGLADGPSLGVPPGACGADPGQMDGCTERCCQDCTNQDQDSQDSRASRLKQDQD